MLKEWVEPDARDLARRGRIYGNALNRIAVNTLFKEPSLVAARAALAAIPENAEAEPDVVAARELSERLATLMADAKAQRDAARAEVTSATESYRAALTEGRIDADSEAIRERARVCAERWDAAVLDLEHTIARSQQKLDAVRQAAVKRLTAELKASAEAIVAADDIAVREIEREARKQLNALHANGKAEMARDLCALFDAA